MSQLSDLVAAVGASSTAAVARVNTEIAALQAQVAAGTASPDDIANLTAIKTQLDGLAQTPSSPPSS